MRDGFVVNVAIHTIAVEPKASPAQIESVIAIHPIAYATLVVTGGRLGDIQGTTAQIGNAAGVAATGVMFFAVEALQSARAGFLVSLALLVTLIMICAAFLAWVRRASARR